MASITTVGYGDIVPESNAERFVAFIAMIAGTAYYSYVIGSVSAIVNQTDTVRQNYLEKMDRVFSYMKHNRLRGMRARSSRRTSATSATRPRSRTTASSTSSTRASSRRSPSTSATRP